MSEMNNTGIVAVGTPTTTSVASTNVSEQPSAYSAYTNNFNYGYNYSTGQYDPAAYAQYCHAYNQYYGYNQQYQYDATTGQYNYYPNQPQMSQNQATTQTSVAVNTPASTQASVQQQTIIGPQLPPPPPPPSTVSQTTTAASYKYPASQATASSVPAVIAPPPPPPIPAMTVSNSVYSQQSNMMMPGTSMVQPPIASNPQFSSSTVTAFQPSTNIQSFNSGMGTTSQAFNTNMSASMQSTTPTTQFSSNLVPTANTTTTALSNSNYGYGYDYNYFNQQFNNTSMNMNTNGGINNPAVSTNMTNYGQQYPYSNPQQNNFQNFQQQYNQNPNQQQQTYNTVNKMQSNQNYETYSSTANNIGRKKSCNRPDSYNVNNQNKYTTSESMSGNGHDPGQYNYTYGNVNKKGKIKKKNGQKNQELGLCQTNTTEPEKPKEKLILSKKVGPVDASKPRGTFAALLGAVEFEPDEYDQSTESESEAEDEDAKQNKSKNLMGTAAFLARATKNTFPITTSTGKKTDLPSAPKRQPKSASIKPITADSAKLEFDPEAFGLPTSFTGRVPKVDDSDSEAFEQNKRHQPFKESFKPKQTFYDWKPVQRNNSYQNAQFDEAEFQTSYDQRSNWKSRQEDSKRTDNFNNNENIKKPLLSLFDVECEPETRYEQNNQNIKHPLTKSKWFGNEQNVSPSAVVPQDSYFDENYEDHNWNHQSDVHKPGVKEWVKPTNQKSYRNNGNGQFDSKPDFKTSRFSEKQAWNQFEDKDDRFPDNNPPYQRKVTPKDHLISRNLESGLPTSFAGKLNTLLNKFLKKETTDKRRMDSASPTYYFAQNTSQPGYQDSDLADFGLPTSFAGKITSKDNQKDGTLDNIQDQDFRFNKPSMSRWDDAGDTDWRKNQKSTYVRDPSHVEVADKNRTFGKTSRDTDFVSEDPYFQHSEYFDSSEDFDNYKEPRYGDHDARSINKRKPSERTDSLMEDRINKLDQWFGRDKANGKQADRLSRFSDTAEPFKRSKPTPDMSAATIESEPFIKHHQSSDTQIEQFNRERINRPFKRLYPLSSSEKEPIKKFQSVNYTYSEQFDHQNLFPPNNPTMEPFNRPPFNKVTQPFIKEAPSAFDRSSERIYNPSSIKATESASFDRGRPANASLFRKGTPSFDSSSSNLKTETFKRRFFSSDVTIEPFKRQQTPSDVYLQNSNKGPEVTIEPFRKSKFSKEVTIEPFRKDQFSKEVTIEPFRKDQFSKEVTIEPLKKVSSDVTIGPFKMKDLITGSDDYRKPSMSEAHTVRKRTGFTDQPIIRVPLNKSNDKPENQSSSHPLVTKLVGTKVSKEIALTKSLTQEVKSSPNKSTSEKTPLNKSVGRPPSPKSIIKKSETTSQHSSLPPKPDLKTPTTKTMEKSTVKTPKPNSTLAFLKTIMSRKADSPASVTTLTVATKPLEIGMDVKPITSKPTSHFGKTQDKQPTENKIIQTKPAEHFKDVENSNNSQETECKLNSVDFGVSASLAQTSRLDVKPVQFEPSDKPGNSKASSETAVLSKPLSSLPCDSLETSSNQFTTPSVEVPTTSSIPKTLSTRPADHFSTPKKSSSQTTGKWKVDPYEDEFQRLIDQVTNVDIKMKMLNTKCDLCSVKLTSNSMAVQHYKGKNHLKKLKSLSPQVNVTSTSQVPVGAIQSQDSNKYCEACQISFQTTSQASTHYSSQDHTAKILHITSQKSKPVFRCELCNITFNYQTELDNHVNGTKHIAKSQGNPLGNIPAIVFSAPVISGNTPNSSASTPSPSPVITKTSVNTIMSEPPLVTSSASTKCVLEAKFGSIGCQKLDTNDVAKSSNAQIVSTKVTTSIDDKHGTTKPIDSNTTKNDTVQAKDISKIPTVKAPVCEKKEITTKDIISNCKSVPKVTNSVSSPMIEKVNKNMTSTPRDNVKEFDPNNAVKGSPKTSVDYASRANPDPIKSLMSLDCLRGGRGGIERGRGGIERGRGGMERGRGGMERGRGGMERGRGGMERGRGGMKRERGGMERGRGRLVGGRGRIDRGRGEFDDGYIEAFGYENDFPYNSEMDYPMPNEPYVAPHNRGPVYHGRGGRQSYDMDRDFDPRDDFYHYPELDGPPQRRIRFM